MSASAATGTLVREQDFMDHCMDVDAHEQAPLQQWAEMFGDEAKEFADLVAATALLAEAAGNNINRPDLERDDMPINQDTIWNARGPVAPGAFDLARRIEVMDLMGIERQLVYPGYGFVGMHIAFNPEAHRFWGFDPAVTDANAMAKRAITGHNNWCMRVAKEFGDRIRPVGLLMTESIDQMMRDTEALIDGGIRAVMIPNGKPPAGISPADAILDPFWNLFASNDVAVTFHIGTEFALLRSQAWDQNVPAFAPAYTLEFTIQPYWGATINFASENYLTAMILGGVLERHPQLRIGSIEVGAQWIGPFAERLDLWAQQFKGRMSSILSMKPSEYINRQVRVAPFFFEDVASYFTRYPALQDVYAFCTDYPHTEGGKSSKQRFSDVLADFDETVRRKFFRDNGLLLLPD